MCWFHHSRSRYWTCLNLHGCHRRTPGKKLKEKIAAYSLCIPLNIQQNLCRINYANKKIMTIRYWRARKILKFHEIHENLSKTFREAEIKRERKKERKTSLNKMTLKTFLMQDGWSSFYHNFWPNTQFWMLFFN